VKYKRKCKPEDFNVFGITDSNVLRKGINDLINPLKNLAATLYIDWEADIGKNNAVVMEIVHLIQKRRVYFHIFHEIDMCEINHVSLACFWILKLRPFFYKSNPRVNINFILATSLFRYTIESVAHKNNKTIDYPTSNLNHAFKYRDLSKESIMAIAESLIC